MSLWIDAAFGAGVLVLLIGFSLARRSKLFEGLRSGRLHPLRTRLRILAGELTLLALTITFLVLRGADPFSFGARIPSFDQALAGSLVLLFFAIAIAYRLDPTRWRPPSKTLGTYPDPRELSAALRPSTPMGWVVWTAVCVVTAIAEELFFRGLLFGRLAELGSPLGAMLFSSIAFGAVHLQYPWRTRLSMVVTGAIFAALFTVGGGLLIPTIGHIFLNAYVVAATARASRSADPTAELGEV